MPRKGSQQPYKPKREYQYTVKDIADLAGMTRNALNVAKARGKIDPGDLKSVVSFPHPDDNRETSQRGSLCAHSGD